MSTDANEFRAFLGEMITSGSRLCTQAIEYRDSMPNSGFERPDGGGAQINGMMDTSLRMMGQLHLMIAQAMHIHGDKIVTAAENYKVTDDQMTYNVNSVLQDAVNAVHNPTSTSSVPGASGS